MGLTGTPRYISGLWRECRAHGDLCKYRFDWSGKCVSRTPFSKENVPLNKQTRVYRANLTENLPLLSTPLLVSPWVKPISSRHRVQKLNFAPRHVFNHDTGYLTSKWIFLKVSGNSAILLHSFAILWCLNCASYLSNLSK